MCENVCFSLHVPSVSNRRSTNPAGTQPVVITFLNCGSPCLHPCLYITLPLQSYTHSFLVWLYFVCYAMALPTSLSAIYFVCGWLIKWQHAEHANVRIIVEGIICAFRIFITSSISEAFLHLVALSLKLHCVVFEVFY